MISTSIFRSEISIKGASLVAFCILALATTTGSSHGEEFNFQEFRRAKFVIDLPSVPEADRKEVTSDGERVTVHTFTCRNIHFVFRLKYYEAPWLDRPGISPQLHMTTFRSGFRRDKQITADKVISKGDIPGREYRLEAEPGLHVRERLFLHGNRLYIMHVAASEEATLDSEHVNRIFDSFQMRDQVDK